MVADTSPSVSQLDVKAVTKGLLDRLALRGVGANSFERLAIDLGLLDDRDIVFFLQGLLAMIRKLPEKAFNYENGRRDLTKALQDALDNIIERIEIAEELGDGGAEP